MAELGESMWEGIVDMFRIPERRKHEAEYCVICHRQMDIPKNMPVGQRRNYYEGAGQICDSCWEMIYGSNGA
ncbi:MAG: hypothetical protein IJ682_03530 [Lachnospiraceae bacterium]|nr:hypothetical protein [Lachnospiraceae bacterium]